MKNNKENILSKVRLDLECWFRMLDVVETPFRLDATWFVAILSVYSPMPIRGCVASAGQSQIILHFRFRLVIYTNHLDL